MNRYSFAAYFLLICTLITAAKADVTRVEIDQRRPLANGNRFGQTGAYESLKGRIYFEVDPTEEVNARVCDLQLAPQNSAGRVEFWADFFLLRPIDPNKGNGCLLYDVHNRGNKLALWTFNDAERSESPSTMAHAGNGYLMREGYSILWTGWNGDVVNDGTGRLLAGLPVAKNLDGSTLTGLNYVEFIVDEPKYSEAFYYSPWGESAAYPTVDVNDPSARLTVRENRKSEAVVVPRDKWAFADFDSGKRVPNPTSLYVEDGFKPGWIYELVYTARDPRVSGLGMVGVRDAISFLRYSQNAKDSSGKPIAVHCDRSIIFGISQSGRMIHHFMYEGMNRDSQGRSIFDGALIHVAGAGKGLFNHRFGMATVYGTQLRQNLSSADFFPFAPVRQEDSTTGDRGDSFERLRGKGGLPKTFFVQTSTEYWSRAASLLHTDVQGTRDIELDDSTRVYLIAGAQHLGATSTDRGICRYMRSPLKHRGPVLRALLQSMDEWIANGTRPPASEYPKISDGTLVSVDLFRKQFPKIAGVDTPAECYQPLRLNPGDRWLTKGIADHVPPLQGEPYRTLVPAVDADGNELAGIRLPDVEVATATYMGWNLRDPTLGAAGVLGDLNGSYLPLPMSRRDSDSREPINERYKSKSDYIAEYAAAVTSLCEKRLLLAEDAILMLQEPTARNMIFDDAD